MKPETVYGIISEKRNEKEIIKQVNGYLAKMNRTTTKSKNKGLLDGFLPYQHSYYYWNLNKDTGTYFEIFMNEDNRRKYHFPTFRQCGWILRVRINLDRFPAATREKAEEFIRGLLSAIAYESRVIQESDDLE
jgi:hypothetical protein